MMDILPTARILIPKLLSILESLLIGFEAITNGAGTRSGEFFQAYLR